MNKVRGEGYKDGGFEFIHIDGQKYSADAVAKWPAQLASTAAFLDATAEELEHQAPIAAAECRAEAKKLRGKT